MRYGNGNVGQSALAGGMSEAELQRLCRRVDQIESKVGSNDCCWSVEEDPQLIAGIASANPVAAGATVAVTATTSVDSEVTDLFVPPSIAQDFVIVSIRAGQFNANMNEAGVPAENLTALADQRAPVKIGRLAAGTQITITVTNIGTAPRTFRASFQGYDLSTKCA